MTEESPKTQFTRTEGKRGGGSLKIFNAEISSQETRTFALSSLEMARKIGDQLDEYPDFDKNSFKNYEGTQTVWLKGLFTMGEWKNTKKSKDEEKSETHIMFEMKADGYDIAFLAQPESFRSNIGSLINSSKGIRRYIGIPTKALGRVLYYLEDANRFVVSPYLITELNEDDDKTEIQQIVSNIQK